jgi:hypothetical protein
VYTFHFLGDCCKSWTGGGRGQKSQTRAPPCWLLFCDLCIRFQAAMRTVVKGHFVFIGLDCRRNNIFQLFPVFFLFFVYLFWGRHSIITIEMILYRNAILRAAVSMHSTAIGILRGQTGEIVGIWPQKYAVSVSELLVSSIVFLHLDIFMYRRGSVVSVYTFHAIVDRDKVHFQF